VQVIVVYPSPIGRKRMPVGEELDATGWMSNG